MCVSVIKMQAGFYLIDNELDCEKENILFSEKKEKYSVDLREKVLLFAVDSIKFIYSIPNKKEYDVFRYQYSKCSTSIGANYEEAQASSIKEFIQKLRIALREANESKYWLKIMEHLDVGNGEKRKYLIHEVSEISRMLGASVSRLSVKIQSN